MLRLLSLPAYAKIELDIDPDDKVGPFVLSSPAPANNPWHSRRTNHGSDRPDYTYQGESGRAVWRAPTAAAADLRR